MKVFFFSPEISYQKLRNWLNDQTHGLKKCCFYDQVCIDYSLYLYITFIKGAYNWLDENRIDLVVVPGDFLNPKSLDASSHEISKSKLVIQVWMAYIRGHRIDKNVMLE